MSVTYTAVLPVRDETVDFLAELLRAERVRRGTRAETRALSCHDQAVLVLRWFLDGTRMRQLAMDNGISKSTGYDYPHEGIVVLAARAPSLHGALLAAKAAGWTCGGRENTTTMAATSRSSALTAPWHCPLRQSRAHDRDRRLGPQATRKHRSRRILDSAHAAIRCGRDLRQAADRDVEYRIEHH